MQMILSFLTVVLVLLLSVKLGQSCSCPLDEEYDKQKVDVMWDSHHNSVKPHMYLGLILEANCKCLPKDNMKVKCMKLSQTVDSNNSMVHETKNYNCRNVQEYFRAFFQFKEYSCDGVVEKAFGKIPYNVSSDSPEDVVDSCKFGGLSEPSSDDCTTSQHPCSYKILVKRVFKGNYTVDQVIYSNGPDVVLGCERPKGTVLQIGYTYMVGLGNFCTKYRDWSLASDYTENELTWLEILEEMRIAEQE